MYPGRLVAIIAALISSIAAPALAAPPTTIWLEGEAATLTTREMEGVIAPSTWAGVMSGDKWLQVSIEAADVEKKVPQSGIVLEYAFEVAAPGKYEIWNRIGFEFVRSPFDWKIDGVSDWKSVSPDEITTDLTEIGFWAEVAWLKLGDLPLTRGKHSLQIRVPRTYDAAHKPQRILYASDALCLSNGPFHPNGKYRPGDSSWRTPADQIAGTLSIALPIPTTPAQTRVSLKGIWQFARWDETLVEDRTGPIHTAPRAEDLIWRSMQVPGDRNKVRPDMTFAHRYFLRTRVDVPPELTGSALLLHIPSVNFIATLFVNGKQAAWSNTPYAPWDVDLTRLLKPGMNEIWLGIKDTYYALSPNDGKNLRYSMVLPTEFFNSNQGVSMQLDSPVWNHMENGILQEPWLIIAGGVYTSDVFAMPSVKTRRLGLEVTVHNSTPGTADLMLENEVIPLAGGPPEKVFEPRSVQVPADADATLRLTEVWNNPALWWPDDPQQYTVVTRIRLGGKIIDERKTKFGFREWEWSGTHFTLNGIPWHGRADLVDYGKANLSALKTWRSHGQNMQRLWGETELDGLEIDSALDFYDEHGIPVRRTGIFDGEGANYGLTEQVKVDEKETTRARRALFDNWRWQLVAWARGQRNHPSIFVWSMENEITFINANVFGLNQYTDPEMKRAAAELSAMDPTRPQMTDGGNALLDESLPIYGGHYLESDFTKYPEEAYTLAEARKSGQPGHQRWPISMAKPILMGESFFAEGNDAASLATVGGESAFVGKAESYPAMGLIAKMLSEGYRWSEQVSFQFWMGGESDVYYNSWQPIAVLCRQWDWRFGSGKRVTRTLGIFNDTRYSDPITLTWNLVVGGKRVGTGTSVHTVSAGTSEKFELPLEMPSVTHREEGELTLTLSTKNRQVFQDVKPLSILPDAIARLPQPINAAASRLVTPPSQHISRLSTTIGLCDPAGTIATFLKAHGITFRLLPSLTTLPSDIRLLLVGRDAVTGEESGSSRLAAFAAAGHTVIVLEQTHPLHYQALPADMTPAQNEGSIAFCEDLDHPIFAGLKQQDFFVWAGSSAVYHNAYEKPVSGARSLVQCGVGLQNSAFAEIPVGGGLMVLSQLAIEETLAVNPVAQQLLKNLVDYGIHYKLTYRPVSYYAAGDVALSNAVKSIGVALSESTSPSQALSKPGSIAILAATPTCLKTLASSPSQISAFTNAGGWIVLCGLTPDGLADYNRIVGFDHMIRPFQREKVSFPPIRSPLLAGLAASNVVMSSGKRIFDFQAGDYPDTNAFSYVVDYEDVAPFGKSPFASYGNITNNFVSADGWPLIINFAIPANNKPFEVPVSFPRPQTIAEFTWVGNTFYWPQTQVNLVFDDKDRLAFKTKPDNSPQTFRISPEKTAKEITLEISGWEPVPGKGALIGIDNIYLKAKRSPEFYSSVKPLLNIGAMMAYPKGKGGIVLCNIKFQDTEVVPENMVKKRNILTVLLRNLNAPFAGGRTLIAGANLTYTPIDLSRQANAYRNERGWFGDKNLTFGDLPSGKHTFAGVTYNVYDFATSPVPTVVMLGGEGVPGGLSSEVKAIPVNRKADALFFLQAARIDSRRSDDDIRHGRKFEMADYIVHYVDGKTERVPIYSEVDVDDFRQAMPAPLPGAQVAWTRPFGNSPLSAVAYSMQWNNPHPDVMITSIDLVYGPDRRGVPALIAVTAANTQ